MLWGEAWGFKKYGVIPFLFLGVPGSSSCDSNDVVGRLCADVGFCSREYDMAVCGL